MAVKPFGTNVILDTGTMAIYLRQIPQRPLTLDTGYTVALNRINTAAEFVEWVAHLSDKTWFDADMLRNFIEAVFYALVAYGNVNVHEWREPAQWTQPKQ